MHSKQEGSVTWMFLLLFSGLMLLGFAYARSPFVTGEIVETVSESRNVDGELFIGVVLGDLPTKFSVHELRLVVDDASHPRHCFQLASSDGVYFAAGQLMIAARGFLPLDIPGFSKYPDILTAYHGSNVTGMLTSRANCDSSTPFSYALPLYFRGDRRRTSVAVNGGNALRIALTAISERGESVAVCRRVSGRAVTFNFWCELVIEPTAKPVRLELKRTIGDGPPRIDAITLRVPDA